jgi:phenylacetate-CoA ligase
MGAFNSLYSKLPVSAQHAAVTAYGFYWRQLRFGPGYPQFVQQYQERERFTTDMWKAWQAEELRKILSICVNHVPYYRDYWTKAQKREALNGCLGILPLLEKDPIRSNPKALLREDTHPPRPQIFLTSGTTGTPISSYYTIPELRQSLALREARSARWAGVSFREARATFSGRMVEPDPVSQGPFYRFNAAEKQVYFSPFHLRPDTAFRYIEALKRHKIQWGTGYAVSYYLLARFMLEKNIPAPDLKAIITTSEKLTSEMRAMMEQAYGCRVYEEYSTVENAVFASECEQGRLHVSPDVAVVEILRPDGSPCDPKEPGEVVATTLSRTYQPLIRFRLGDTAVWDPDSCPCGRQMPVIKEILGRIEDVVVGPDGRQMVRFHGIFIDQPHIREGQIIQEALDRIRVKVVPVDGFNESDVNIIKRRIYQRLGNNVNVIVEPISDIPRTKAGKFKAVISMLTKNGQQ